MISKSAEQPLYEQVLKKIESQIIAGVYKQGDLLPSEKELIDNMGVSRITIRKALSILSEMGLIKTDRGRGSEVLFNPEFLKDNESFAAAAEEYKHKFIDAEQIRLMLEPEIAKQVALTIDDAQIEYLREIIEEAAPLDLQTDFHMAVIRALRNETLNHLFTDLLEEENNHAPAGFIPPDQQIGIMETFHEQHRKIFEAIEHHDGEFAYFYMKEHTLYVSQVYEEYFKHL
ncbi:FadR/GntR family transcriptional regulator [Hespellia stercorisuis]|uniref:GntR family transcriptional regulator, transcriptional repressor for pyruvate dehydrogenase complex n=1 Tax=Hespellia stercorisuis DSM 15480 TaxID=1121950 RepID=A0A1M6TVY8_9FIRM|nr:GntR family transcriptional regulator [Hespellia stercorisuis]SHK61053.1 GntR family transcriptional regulator, transcriptional repressor for pyruvate dehydrogenase complex [Hespellia stercorisuis DSM 15480]